MANAPKQAADEVARARVRHEYFSDSIEVIHEIMMDKEAGRLVRLQAARWIAERTIPKAEAPREGPTGEIALILAETLKEVMRRTDALPVIEGDFHELERVVGKPLVLGKPDDDSS